ncbi:neuropilin and tolloid-like protein 2 [Teleopsis dalmanni]|uniref:neuropilin and tolloid-like protein 2 n=1 Tax=Teleopsis dalmanni TaxID=139649 RepID=UPI0018CFE12F|nr:neuropilin and tolloid-like protein 2 [Teleopsis dalmanni]
MHIRDGQYGFSNLIGKYCGTDFPDEITSKERYLWLHFHSDESIEYSGFTAVYEFIDRNREAPITDLNCTIDKDGYEGFINSTDVPTGIKETVTKNKIALDCIWRIQVQDKWKIQVKFLQFRLNKPNDCNVNFLDIFPEQTVMPLRVKNFCGSAGEGITSESNILNMRFYAEPQAITSEFSILYTAFRDRGNTCSSDEYDCEDATCISKELKCNGRDNCKFRWDEEGCDKNTAGQSEHVIIIIVVFGLILGGMVITFLVNCIRKIMRDQKIIRDVPVLGDGIYHIDSFLLSVPKTAIFVGLQNDWTQKPNISNELTEGDNHNVCQMQDELGDEEQCSGECQSSDCDTEACYYIGQNQSCTNYKDDSFDGGDDEFVIVTNWNDMTCLHNGYSYNHNHSHNINNYNNNNCNNECDIVTPMSSDSYTSADTTPTEATNSSTEASVEQRGAQTSLHSEDYQIPIFPATFPHKCQK